MQRLVQISFALQSDILNAVYGGDLNINLGAIDAAYNIFRASYIEIFNGYDKNKKTKQKKQQNSLYVNVLRKAIKKH